MLDVFAQIGSSLARCARLCKPRLTGLASSIYLASIAVGYNHPDLIKLAKTDEFATAAMARPALGSFPSTEWAEIIETGLLKVAPAGLDQLCTMQCGSSANEVRLPEDQHRQEVLLTRFFLSPSDSSLHMDV